MQYIPLQVITHLTNRVLSEQQEWLRRGIPAEDIVPLTRVWLGMMPYLDKDCVYRRPKLGDLARSVGYDSALYLWRLMERSGSFGLYDGSWQKSSGVFPVWLRECAMREEEQLARQQMVLDFKEALGPELCQELDLVEVEEEECSKGLKGLQDPKGLKGSVGDAVPQGTKEEKEEVSTVSEGFKVSKAQPLACAREDVTSKETKETKEILFQSFKYNQEENKKREEAEPIQGITDAAALFHLPDPMPSDIPMERIEATLNYFNQLNVGSPQQKQLLIGLHARILEVLGCGRQHGFDLMVWMVSNVLVPHFACHKRDFVGRSVLGRNSWLKNWTRGEGALHEIRRCAERLKSEAQRQQLADASRQQHEAARLNRPLSPHEWQDPLTGKRYYDDPRSGREAQLPVDAPARPDESSFWNKLKRQWRTIATQP